MRPPTRLRHATGSEACHVSEENVASAPSVTSDRARRLDNQLWTGADRASVRLPVRHPK
jgi:hypothetical protein